MPTQGLMSTQGLKFTQGLMSKMGLPRWLTGKVSACQCRRHKRHWFDHWIGKIPWRRKWLPSPVFWPGNVHGQRSLAGYSPWDCRVGHN